MNEEQDKSIENWLKKRLAERRLRKYLIVIAILFVICAITFVAVVMSIPGTIYYGPEGTLNNIKSEIQAAVQDYQNNNGEGLPTINGTITVNGSLCHIIDICALLVPEGGKLNQVLDHCTSVNGSDNDNCDAGCEGCWEDSHYIWVVDEAGKVYSTCVGSNCSAYNTDGYQGVWP